MDTCEDLFTGAKDSYEALGKCISTVTGQSCTVLTGQLVSILNNFRLSIVFQ